jgi:hypothetical protein
MTPGLPEILGLATRMAQLDSRSTCDASLKSHAQGPLISSSLDAARPHFVTSNATIDPSQRALVELSTWTAIASALRARRCQRLFRQLGFRARKSRSLIGHADAVLHKTPCGRAHSQPSGIPEWKCWVLCPRTIRLFHKPGPSG